MCQLSRNVHIYFACHLYSLKGYRRYSVVQLYWDPSGELHLRTGGPPVAGVQNRKQFSNISLTLPEEAVPGSARCSISITG